MVEQGQLTDSRAIKMIALRLLDLNWFDRRWLLRQLGGNVAARVQAEIQQLRLMGVNNGEGLYQQFCAHNALNFSGYLQQQPASTAALAWLQQHHQPGSEQR